MTPSDHMKHRAKAVWSVFSIMENFTGTAGPRLAQFADIDANDKVWDVACGTGVVALTAARCGLSVTTANLTSALIKRAKENLKIFNLDVDLHECNGEDLPFKMQALTLS